MNEPCISSAFYDAHDIWHFLSAIALAATIFLLMHSGEESGGDKYEKVEDEKSVDQSITVDESTPLIAHQ
jgi:hypothetical protein